MQGLFLKFFSFLLSILTFFGLIKAPQAAIDLNEADHYPLVFVHGVLGWGDEDALDIFFDYWGADRDIPKYLESKGVETHVASVGPISSAWDRACELYAQITGTRVDYGLAHSQKHNHDRYGKTYDTPFIEDWSSENKINLIGHSFGGATIRQLLALLAFGCEEEIAATDEDEISPLFTGGKKDLIHSITTLAAPHNGVSLSYVFGEGEPPLLSSMITAYSLYGNSGLRHISDPKLDHWGISVPADGKSWSSFSLENIDRFLESQDNAIADLTFKNAAALNEKLALLDNVYYYSYYGSCTKESPVTGNHVCYTTSMFTATGNIIGALRGEFEGVTVDDSWLANDGLVNVISGKYPFGQDFKEFELGKQEIGKWQVMPEKVGWNHLTFTFANDLELGETELVDFYVNHLNIIAETYA